MINVTLNYWVLHILSPYLAIANATQGTIIKVTTFELSHRNTSTKVQIKTRRKQYTKKSSC